MTKRLDYNQIAPNGAKALGGVKGYVMHSGLPAELVDLVYLRVSQINNCAYCLDTHTRDLTKKGVPIEKLALVQAWAEGGNLFSETERAALAWAETLTRVAQKRRTGRDVPGSTRGLRREGAGRPRDRDRPDERLQSDGDQLPQDAPGGDRKLTKPHRPGSANTWKEFLP